jgi:hypothetical protein
MGCVQARPGEVEPPPPRGRSSTRRCSNCIRRRHSDEYSLPAAGGRVSAGDEPRAPSGPLRKSDTSLRQNGGDIARDNADHYRSESREMTPKMRSYVCHERGEGPHGPTARGLTSQSHPHTPLRLPGSVAGSNPAFLAPPTGRPGCTPNFGSGSACGAGANASHVRTAGIAGICHRRRRRGHKPLPGDSFAGSRFERAGAADVVPLLQEVTGQAE